MKGFQFPILVSDVSDRSVAPRCRRLKTFFPFFFFTYGFSRGGLASTQQTFIIATIELLQSDVNPRFRPATQNLR